MKREAALERNLRYLRNREADLTVRQQTMLMVLGWKGDRLTRVLAAELGVTKPIITRGVRTLRELGYATSVRPDYDYRQCVISATDEGRAYLERLLV